MMVRDLHAVADLVHTFPFTSTGVRGHVSGLPVHVSFVNGLYLTAQRAQLLVGATAFETWLSVAPLQPGAP